MNKPNDADAAFFALPGHRVVAFEGRDAVAFLHAQCMSDVAALADGHWQWSGWLTPKGRVIALFALLRLDAETLWLVSADTDAGELATRLGRFVFRSKVTIRVRDDLAIAGAFAAPSDARDARADVGQEGDVQLDLSGAGGSRILRIGTRQATGDAGQEARWMQADIAHGLPRLPAGQVEQWTPQQLSLERLRAYSVRKGCYPGQEIVARTHFLGQSKRALVRLRGERMAARAAVTSGDATVGQLVCSSGDSGLAVLAADAPLESLAIDGRTCTVVPLLDGLAR
jgi:tRNA-modifying protein YgfZ